jgi:lipopolysaccharide/colanic/teichoic acid biosynthesis glycosyltransferase
MMPPQIANLGSASASVVTASEFYLHDSDAASVAMPCAEPMSVDSAALSSVENPLMVRPDGFHNAKPTEYFRIKTWVDRCITAFLLLVAIPLMAVVGIAILVLDGRPIFFRQVRVGKDGNRFEIWKFRTMLRNAEQCTGPVWSSAGDARVTSLGRWLRRTHLDELPQFINVLKGDMNLIGPRPERPEFVVRLAKEVPGYLNRNQVRPGITGLAQLRLGYDESIAGVPRKLQCDMEYISGTSFLGDVRLLAKTLPHIATQIIGSQSFGNLSHAVADDASWRASVPAPQKMPTPVFATHSIKRKPTAVARVIMTNSEVA